MVEHSHSEEDKNDGDGDGDGDGEEEEDYVQLTTCRLPVRGAATATSGLASKDISSLNFHF